MNHGPRQDLLLPSYGASDLKVAKITVKDETYVRYRKNRQFYPASLTLELCPRQWKQCLANVRLASPTEQQWKQC